MKILKALKSFSAVKLTVLGTGGVLLVFGLILLFGFKSVQAYESCLLVRNGNIEADWGPGLHWHFVPLSDVACYRTARTTYEASPGQKGGGADFNDDPVEARSKDGQIIDAVSFRIAFHVPTVMTGDQETIVDPNNLRTIYTTVGASGQKELVSSVVAFYARPTVRTVMQLHTSEELLQGDLSVISHEIEDRLRPLFAEQGLVLENVLLSKPDFNDEFEAKVQQRQQAAVDVEIEKQKALQAEQQGQGRISAANADATVAAIAAGAEANRAVIEAKANATVVAVESQAEADQTVLLANAEATAVAAQIAAYGGPDAFLRALQIQAMSGWPVQVLGETDALPLIVITPVPASTPMS